MVPAPASLALLALLQERRPWANRGAVAAALRAWADHHWGEGSLTPGDPDGAAEVAERHMWASRDVRLDMIREGLDEMSQS